MDRSHTSILVKLLALCAALAAVATVSACGDGAARNSAPSPAADPVVLLVDGRPIHLSAVEAVQAELRLGGGADGRVRAEKEVVRRELLRNEAERLGVRADQAEVDARRTSMADEAGGEDALDTALRAVPISEEQLRSGIEDGVLHEAVRDAKFAHLKATTRQARSYYRKNQSSFREEASLHLYAIRVPAERVAESALERLRAGRPFDEVARQFGTDGEAKANGGDMGVVALSSLPASFVQALEGAAEGKVVGPVQGPGGWFVLKATAVTRTHVTSFAEVRDDLVAELTRRERFRALERWLDDARAKASVTRP